MRVINISTNDWANFGYDNAKALSSVGVDANSYCLYKHPFNYSNASEVVTEHYMTKLIQESDIIQIMHTDLRAASLCLPFVNTSRKFYVYHTGTPYRRNPELANKAFNPIVHGSFTDHCELVNLGAKNCKYVATAIDIDKLQTIRKAKHTLNYKPVIGHFPSNPKTKGTENIKTLLTSDKILSGRFDINIDTSIIPHDLNLERIAKCDIYFELFNPTIDDKPYGHWGVTAFEAAAMGLYVITQNIAIEEYTKAYGQCPFFLLDELTASNFFKLFLDMCEDGGLINGNYKYGQDIINERHSYAATGKYLLSLLK